jgi:hypothetical protein
MFRDRSEREEYGSNFAQQGAADKSGRSDWIDSRDDRSQGGYGEERSDRRDQETRIRSDHSQSEAEDAESSSPSSQRQAQGTSESISVAIRVSPVRVLVEAESGESVSQIVAEQLPSLRTASVGSAVFVAVHVAVSHGHEFAQRDRRARIVPRNANAQRELVATLSGVNFH